MSTRDAILDSFESLIIEQGERSATLARVAEQAGLSKGGLLYHFGSKESLVEGLAERFRGQSQADTQRLRTLDDPVGVFLRESLAIRQPADRTFVALNGLAQLDEYPVAKRALAEFDELAMAVLTEVLGDAALAQLVLRLSDGFYLRAALGLGEEDAASIEPMMAHLRRLLP